MRPPGSAEALEVRRKIAIRLLEQGNGVRQAARLVGASPSSVLRWKQAFQKEGEQALRSKPHPGRKPKLSSKQKEELEHILLQGAKQAGFDSDLWTLRRISEVIHRRFGVRYHPSHVWKLLKQMGWSWQRPRLHSRERDPKEVEKWKKRWPEVKKKPTGKA